MHMRIPIVDSDNVYSASAVVVGNHVAQDLDEVFR
jgi:hypothetical protein